MLFVFTGGVFAAQYNYDVNTLSAADVKYLDTVTDRLQQYLNENGINKKYYFIFIFDDYTFDLNDKDHQFMILLSDNPNIDGQHGGCFNNCDILCYEYHFGDYDFFNTLQSDKCREYYERIQVLYTNFSNSSLDTVENESFFSSKFLVIKFFICSISLQFSILFL